MNPAKKKLTKKFKSPLNFRPRKKITREFPLNLIWVHFNGKSFVFFFHFQYDLKKIQPIQRAFLNFCIQTPKMTKFKTHKKFLGTIFKYTFKYYIFVQCLIYLKMKNLKDTFDYRPTRTIKLGSSRLTVRLALNPEGRL